MGIEAQPLNTFWQLLFRAPGATGWALVTPPGVADNGGLTVTVGSTGTATVGFEPSQRLHYSPLALSQNDGASWSPALVPTSLAASPDALAVTPDGSGRALALVRRGSGKVLASSGTLLTWSPLAGSLLSSAGTGCAIEGFDAVAFGPAGMPMIGTGCSRPGRVGVFALAGRHWQLVGPTLAGSLDRSTTRVLRLASSNGATSALVMARGRVHTDLIALWRSADGAWSDSRPLPMTPGSALGATAVGVNGEELVLLKGSPSATDLEMAAGPGQAWSRLPSPPHGTVTLSLLADGNISAFAVKGSNLRIFTLAPHGTTWMPVQKMSVPISYGSS
jgi:hypothetical protein